jgi:hypothetical protein
MVYEIASVQMASGKEKEAREWAKDIGEYTSKTYRFEGHMVAELTPAPGQGGRVTWISRFDSLSSWAAFYEKLPGDEGFQKRANSHRDARIPASFTRTVYRTT